MGMTIAELLLAGVLGYGLFRLLKPFQERLERALRKFTHGKPDSKGRVIEMEPENNKKKGS